MIPRPLANALAILAAVALAYWLGDCRGVARTRLDSRAAELQQAIDTLTARADSLRREAGRVAAARDSALARARADSIQHAKAAAKVRVVSPGVVEIRDPLAGAVPRVVPVPVEVTERLEADARYIASLQISVSAALASAAVERARAEVERARADSALALVEVERQRRPKVGFKTGVALGVLGTVGLVLLAR